MVKGVNLYTFLNFLKEKKKKIPLKKFLVDSCSNWKSSKSKGDENFLYGKSFHEWDFSSKHSNTCNYHKAKKNWKYQRLDHSRYMFFGALNPNFASVWPISLGSKSFKGRSKKIKRYLNFSDLISDGSKRNFWRWFRIQGLFILYTQGSRSLEGQIEEMQSKNLKKILYKFLRSLNRNPRSA